MNFYNTYILPKLLNIVMSKKEFEKERPLVVSDAKGVVLEIGFGSGLNLPYYQNIEKLYALEPSVELYELTKVDTKNKFEIEHLSVSAENIPLQDNSVDSVVSTWTLCSIPDVEQSLKEILRVLKPGGRFHFIEHGKFPKTLKQKLQTFLTPLSKVFAGGCHLNREVDILLKEAGFILIELHTFELPGRPLAYMYQGVGEKPAEHK
jgi:ubiquinone/menaquinone biosynthesis C-methylase UbiE